MRIFQPEPVSFQPQPYVIAHNSPITKEKDWVKSIIISTAEEFNISSGLLVDIAKCESGLNPEAKNPRSTASGIFQFINSTFIHQAQAYGLPTDDKNDPVIQIKLAANMIRDGGLHHWNASKSCWSR